SGCVGVTPGFGEIEPKVMFFIDITIGPVEFGLKIFSPHQLVGSKPKGNNALFTSAGIGSSRLNNFMKPLITARVAGEQAVVRLRFLAGIPGLFLFKALIVLEQGQYI